MNRVSMRITILFILLLIGTNLSYGQNTGFTLSGKVKDAATKTPLSQATVSVTGTSTGTHSDSTGFYKLVIPAGIHKIRFEFVGYATIDTVLNVNTNIKLNVSLKPSDQFLKEVQVKSTAEVRKTIETQSLTVLQGTELERTRGLSLGESLKSITGVTTFQTGPSIAKPIIHGLYSNRILILNNGVRLEAQQWGSEHAPEIDPFIANRIEVIKGAAGIRYGSDAIAGVILAEPKALPTTPGTMDGEVNAVGMSNSRLGAFSAMVEGALGKKLEGFSYRIQGSYKRAGNTSTPNYILGNTGLSENDFSAALQYYHKNYGVETYYSNFNTKLGILAGTEVGSIADLKARIQETVPTTPADFTYTIDRPYQTVNHATAKVRGFYNFDDGSKLQIQYAYQTNKRSEYDLLSYSTSLNPSLYLKINTSTADINFDQKPIGGLTGSIGVSGMNQGNVRMYQYLIPNFVDYDGGAYIIERYRYKKLLFEAGIRYDYRWLKAYRFNDTVAKIEATTTHYQSSSSTLGATYNITSDLSLSGNFGSAFRAPTVNELYSNGVHQTLISYEVGDPNLKTERASNFSLNLNYQSHRVAIDLQGYYNNINNFIFLQPTGQYTRVQSGSLLMFDYTQANVFFRGIDLGVIVKPLDSLEINSKTSLIYAYNKTIHDYLIYTPPMRLQNGVTYHFGSLGAFKNLVLGAENVFVAKQTKVPANQDYAPPPGAYSLYNAHLGFRLIINHTYAAIDLSVNNLTNVAYKDYLDRFRYFANEPGRNIIFRLRVPFSILQNNK
ncbi:TonB-dependent receptor [Mucilaginibacter polytrichastri]|nr:TonB-dependent receptor [Mucilaginibacter polytrichastri]